jgi:group I intron endonuclease
MTGIYCWYNTVNKKRYCGQSVDLEHRRMGHTYDLRAGTHYNGHLQKAWNKYGEDNFEFRIIEPHVPVESLDARECFWIDYYDTTNQHKGYNKKTGGKANHVLCEESKQKISKTLMGHPVSAETREKNSRAKRGTKMHPNARAALLKALTGRVVSAESRAKVSAANKGKLVSDEARRKLSVAFKGKKRGHMPMYEMLKKKYEAERALPPEEYAKLLESRKRGPQTPEHIAKCAALRRGKKLNLSPEQRRKRSMNSKRLRGPMSDELRRVHSEAAKKHGIGLWSRGRVNSDEYKQKMREVMTGRTVTWADKIKAGLRKHFDEKRAKKAQAQLNQPELFQQAG